MYKYKLEATNFDLMFSLPDDVVFLCLIMLAHLILPLHLTFFSAFNDRTLHTSKRTLMYLCVYAWCCLF